MKQSADETFLGRKKKKKVPQPGSTSSPTPAQVAGVRGQDTEATGVPTATGDLRSQLADAFETTGNDMLDRAGHDDRTLQQVGLGFKSVANKLTEPFEPPKLKAATSGVGEGAPSGKLPEPPTELQGVDDTPLFGEQA